MEFALSIGYCAALGDLIDRLGTARLAAEAKVDESTLWYAFSGESILADEAQRIEDLIEDYVDVGP